MLAFLLSNIRPILYAIVALVVAYMAYKLYDVIRENGANQVVIEQMDSAIKSQKKVIDQLTQDKKLQEDVILERDQELEDLNTRLDKIIDDLGVDEDDAAAESLKELFRRLGKL